MSDLMEQLRAPFPPSDIDWRIGQAGVKEGKPWAKCLAYITNRAIMERLDAVMGPANWKNELREWTLGAPGVICRLSLRVGGEWIAKEDGADQPDTEPVKGGFSNAMKRAAVLWGMGRYLYDLPEGWAVIGPQGKHWQAANDKKQIPAFKWDPPALPKWALPDTASDKVKQATEALDGFAATLGQPLLFPKLGSGKHTGKLLKDVPHEDLAAFHSWIIAGGATRAAKYGEYVIELIQILDLSPTEASAAQ